MNGYKVVIHRAHTVRSTSLLLKEGINSFALTTACVSALCSAPFVTALASAHLKYTQHKDTGPPLRGNSLVLPPYGQASTTIHVRGRGGSSQIPPFLDQFGLGPQEILTHHNEKELRDPRTWMVVLACP